MQRHNNLTDNEVMMMKINCCVSRNKQREVFAAPKQKDKDDRWKMYVGKSMFLILRNAS